MAAEPKMIEVSCSRARQEMVIYMECDLSFESFPGIGYHLLNCKDCSAVYDGAKNVAQLLKHENFLELPQGFSERLRKRLQFAR
jgi:hypothetical protein